MFIVSCTVIPPNVALMQWFIFSTTAKMYFKNSHIIFWHAVHFHHLCFILVWVWQQGPLWIVSVTVYLYLCVCFDSQISFCVILNFLFLPQSNIKSAKKIDMFNFHKSKFMTFILLTLFGNSLNFYFSKIDINEDDKTVIC